MKKSSRGFYEGRFNPINKEKYLGDVNNIIFRSSWELSFARFLDRNPNILKWSSESIVIPYLKKTDNKIHRYFPDFFLMYKNKNGEVISEVIEIKPRKEMIPAMVILESDFKRMPSDKSKNPKTRLYNKMTALVNASKWKYALEYCEKRGIKFRVICETELFK